MNMKKTLFLLILALFLSLGVPAWAEEGIEVVVEDGASVVAVDVGVYAPAGFFGKGDFVLPSSLITIEDSAFEGIGAEKVEVPGNVSSIGARAFADCRSLTAIHIPATVDTIHDTAFEGSDGVTIYGEAFSEAARHAEANGVPFTELSSGADYYITGPEPPVILPFVPLT